MLAGACVLALASGSAEARKAVRCASPAEVTSMQTTAIQQMLMDAALTCGDTALTSYNAFQTSFGPELRRSDKTLLRMFIRVMGGSKGDKAYNLFKTELASKAELQRIHGEADFCKAANLVVAAALQPEKPRLEDFVSGVPVSDVPSSNDIPGAVGSCQLEVAVTLQGAMAGPGVVPKPNPLRLAALTPETAAPAMVAPSTPPAAPPVNPAPATTPAASPAVPPPEPKKKSSGWFSGLLN